MKIYDISLPIKNSMLVWEGDAKVSINQIATIKKDKIRLSNVSFGSHTGTHIDAPSHFLEEGRGIDEIALEKLIGHCKVIDLININHWEILPEDLVNADIKKGDRILFKTRNFRLLKKSTFPKNYISLSEKGAYFLVDRGVSLVGTDFLGIEKKSSPGHPVHKALLKAKIVIVEGLDLSKVKEGMYDFVCLPLRIVEGDGSPARAILIKI